MILGIEVLCEACGTELEIPDVTTDHLLKVTLKARPCPKCNRPPDCHLSCEDVLGLRRKLKAAVIQTLPSDIRECFGTSNNSPNCPNCPYRVPCSKLEEDDNDKDTDYPSYFGDY